MADIDTFTIWGLSDKTMTEIMNAEDEEENKETECKIFEVTKCNNNTSLEPPTEKEFNMNLEILKCPITHDIFYDPVIAQDGIVYERVQIENWLMKNKTSPIKRCEMADSLVECILIKNLVEEFLQKNPEFKCEQYKPNMSYTFNKQRIITFVSEKRFDKLLFYNSFDLEDMISNALIETILKSNNAKSILHVIDNAININASYNGYTLLHKVCRHSNTEILQYLLKKDINVNGISLDGWTPLSLLCKYGSYNSLKSLCEVKDLDYDGNSDANIYPLLLIAEDGDIDSVRLIVNKVKNLKVVNSNNRNFMYIFRRNKNSSSEERKNFILEMTHNKDIVEMLINEMSW